MGGRVKGKKLVRVTLPDHIVECLKVYARRKGLPIEAVIEEALKRYVQRPGFAHRRLRAA